MHETDVTTDTCYQGICCSQCFKQLAASLNISYCSVIHNMQKVSKYLDWGNEEEGKSEGTESVDKWQAGPRKIHSMANEFILSLDLLISVHFTLQLTC